MAMGLEMLMKSFGVDPDEIKVQMAGAQQKLNEELQSFHQQMNRIEAKQAEILNRISDLEESKARELITLNGN